VRKSGEDIYMGEMRLKTMVRDRAAPGKDELHR
jgi:hypothetical protein